MAKTHFGQMAAVFCVISLVKCESHSTCFDQEMLNLQDPFKKVKTLFNISSDSLSGQDLEGILSSYYKGIHCDGAEENSPACPACLTSSELDNIAALNITNGVTKEDFTTMAMVLALHRFSGEFCRGNKTEISMANRSISDFRSKLLEAFTGATGRDHLEEEEIQEGLEQFLETYSEDEHGHEEEHDHEDERDDEEEEGLSDEHDEHDDDHHIEPIKDKCVSAGLLLEQLGHYHGDHVEEDDVGNLAALIVYHILAGSKVADECRNLPMPSFFVTELFNDSDTISEEYFKTKILGAFRADVSSLGEEAEEEHGHNHKRRRREAEHQHSEEQWSRCYTGEELLAIFSVPEGGNITQAKFAEICPSLIQEKITGACNPTKKTHMDNESGSDAQRYGYATLAVVIVCICSLCGVMVLPLAKKSVFQVLMEVFRGLAVGTLASDPILHLLPESFGVHRHEVGEDNSHATGPIIVEEFVWYGMVALAGIYVFYLLELVMKRFEMYKGNGGETDDDLHTNHDFNIATISTESSDKSATSSKAELYKAEASDKSMSTSNKKASKGIAPLALMVIIGDAIHNFADGLAIGAAFTQNNTAGLATTIAVFCHELPHEFGDFAVLVSSGLSIPRALCWNLISSLTALIGVYLGLAVSTDMTTRYWIFAVTSGLFLYIALTDLLPDLLQTNAKEKGYRSIVCNNIGLLLGVALMFILAIFEERINI